MSEASSVSAAAAQHGITASAPPRIVTRQILRAAPGPRCHKSWGPLLQRGCWAGSLLPLCGLPFCALDSCGHRGPVPGALPRPCCPSAGRPATRRLLLGCAPSDVAAPLPPLLASPTAAVPCSLLHSTTGGALRGAGPALGPRIPGVHVTCLGSLLPPARLSQNCSLVPEAAGTITLAWSKP